MKRLTTETPNDNFGTMLNYVYGKDGWVYIRHDGENGDVPLAEREFMNTKPKSRFCTRFHFDERGDRYCCADCRRKAACRNPCANDPSRCRLEDVQGEW